MQIMKEFIAENSLLSLPSEDIAVSGGLHTPRLLQAPAFLT
jgi:hypothetical protein